MLGTPTNHKEKMSKSATSQESHKKKTSKKKNNSEGMDKQKARDESSSRKGEDLTTTVSEELDTPFWDGSGAESEIPKSQKEVSQTDKTSNQTETRRKVEEKGSSEKLVDKEEVVASTKESTTLSKLAKCDKAFMKALMKITAASAGNDEISSQVDIIMSEYTKVKTITLELSHDNKFQEGRLKELEERTKVKTFAEVTKQGPTDVTHTEDEGKQKTSALIITSDTMTPKRLQSVLKKKIDPSKVGLMDATMRMGREGVVVTTTSKEALENLKGAIYQDKEIGEVHIKTPKSRRLEMKVVGIDPDTEMETLNERIINQNHLQCDTEDIEIRRHWTGKNGVTAILALSKRAILALGNKTHLNVSWNRCPIYDNIFVPRCTHCASLGHTIKECRGRLRCTNCGLQGHEEKECENEPRCRLCMEEQLPPEETSHAMMSWRCPTYTSLIQEEKSRALQFID